MGWISEVSHSLYGFLTAPELWKWIGKTFLRIAIIIILAFIVKSIGNKTIDTIFKDRKGLPIRLTTNRREQTLKNLLKNILSYTIVFIVIMMILYTFNVPFRTRLRWVAGDAL